jgi:hypothetical protein
MYRRPVGGEREEENLSDDWGESGMGIHLDDGRTGGGTGDKKGDVVGEWVWG